MAEKDLGADSLRVLQECETFDVFVGPGNLVEAAELYRRDFVDPFDDYEGCRIKITAAGRAYLNAAKKEK